MFGAIAPVRLTYSLPFDPSNHYELAMSTLFTLVNGMLVDRLELSRRLPNQTDADEFFASLKKRMVRDQIRAATDYALNMGIMNDDGIESSQGVRALPLAGDDQIRMLGVTPNRPLTADPPAYYMDVATPALPETLTPNDYFLRHMFWRSHIDELCAEPNLAAQLRERCISAAASPGGDPDACTQCVQVAELHMPSCIDNFGPSKCGVSFPGFPGHPARRVSSGSVYGNEAQEEAEEARRRVQA